MIFTYKELLKTFLAGRNSSNAINVKFFQSAFEQNPSFGWNFAKMLLKCILSLKSEKVQAAKETSRKNSGEDIMMAEDKKSKKKDKKK